MKKRNLLPTIIFFFFISFCSCNSQDETPENKAPNGQPFIFKQDVDGEGNTNILIYNDVSKLVDRYEKEKQDILAEMEKLSIENKRLKPLLTRLREIESRLQIALEDKQKIENLNYELRRLHETFLSQQIPVGPKSLESKNTEKYKDLQFAEKSEENIKILIKEIKDADDIERLEKNLHILIDQTESMDDDEKQYWRDILWVLMTFDQKIRLFKILATERMKFFALEKKYKNEMIELDEKRFHEWTEFQYNKEKKLAEESDDKEALELLQVKKHIMFEKPPIPIRNLRTAENLVKKFIKKYPNNVNGYLYYSEIMNSYQENRSYDIVCLFEKNLHRFKNDSKFLKILAQTSARLPKKEKESIEYFKEALLLIEDDPDLDCSYCELLFKINNDKLKKEDLINLKFLFERSFNEKSESPSFISWYLSILWSLDQHAKIIDFVEEFHKTKKETQTTFDWLAWAFYKTKNYSKAAENFIKAAEFGSYPSPGSFAMAALSTYENNKKNIKNAKELLEKALDTNLDSLEDHEIGELHLALALINYELGINDDVINHAVSAIDKTYGCSENLMIELNWHKNMMELLEKNRYNITCP